MLSGCAAHQSAGAQTELHGGPALGQGAAWEAVFLPPPTERAVAAAAANGAAAEHARRDAALTVRSSYPPLAAVHWPEPDRPTLERPRWIHLPRDANLALFFMPRDGPPPSSFRRRAW